LAVSAPLSADSPELAELTAKAFSDRSMKAGLSAAEAELILSQYQKHLFESSEMVVAVRLPQAFLDEKLPLTVEPEPRKMVRVAWLVLSNVDPQLSKDIEALVSRLGDAKYAEREAATKRLTDLGPLAFPALRQGLSHADLEVVSRCERILLAQNQTLEAPKNAAANAVQGVIRQVFGK
jgi:hypothetical protein